MHGDSFCDKQGPAGSGETVLNKYGNPIVTNAQCQYKEGHASKCSWEYKLNAEFSEESVEPGDYSRQ